MKKNSSIKIVIVFILVCAASCSVKKNDFVERVKIALRDTGNKVLLSNGDSTSLILPVKELKTNIYRLGFNNTLTFEPNNLVVALDESFESAGLPEDYRVEVIQCNDNEVAYSYQITEDVESTIIPCSGRYLPDACYLIEVKFLKLNDELDIFKTIVFSLIFLIVIGFVFFMFKNPKIKIEKPLDNDVEKLGSFYFYPEQNKLVKEAIEIALSKKECELLALFVERPNEILKRDELMKKVWEDNGVFVGRSLDTYISKLRKKLQADTSIKITNIHGVGYKLEIK
ncbi:winged helix-turn-helix domain-containing protein [Winogradskyella sp. PE311]|uniref:winged helix-turn-helix domain-containing protein n=1 Tax=Winogradskyella sp. PE311 TaxID=3366943 RepID=UPI00397FEB9B